MTFTKFKITPTIIVITAVITLAAFGTWQAKRLIWKKQLIEEVNYNLEQKPVKIENCTNIENCKYRLTEVEGELLHEHEIHLYTGPRVPKGKPGYNILTPLKQKNGKIILVDRGWVQKDLKNVNMRPESQNINWVKLAGTLHSGEKQKFFIHDNNLNSNLWFWIDLQAVSKQVGESVGNFYLRAINKSNTNSEIIPGTKEIQIRNDHLQYAITWYSLAIILIVIYVLYHRKT